MKKLIIILLTALILSTAVVYDSGHDIQRAMRTQRARKARRRKDESLGLFMDY